jgi:hypothetical protein
MKTYMTPEEHARLHRRRARQALGLLVAVLVLVGAVTVVRAGVRTVANLFDDTQQRQEYEDKIEGLVLFDPVPFDGIENIDDLTLREAAVWGCVYSIQAASTTTTPTPTPSSCCFPRWMWTPIWPSSWAPASR